MTARASIRLLAAAVVVAAALGLSACSDPAMIDPYQPGVGANASAGPVALRSLVLVAPADGKQATLHGAMVSTADDTLTGVTATALKADLTAGSQLTVTSSSTAAPQGTLVQLGAVKVSGDGLTPGLVARLTFTFEKGGSVTVDVPIVSSDNPDFQTAGA